MRKNPRGSPAGIHRDDVRWAYRLLLDREPGEGEIERMLAAASSIVDLRRVLLSSEEFRQKNPIDLAFTSEQSIVLKEIGPGLRLFLDLSDVEIGLNVARDRYEPGELAFVRDSLARGDFVVDVGANIGFYSLWMAAFVGPMGHVYAYEPVESNAALLERSLLENGLDQRVTLRRDAVGLEKRQGEIVFLSLQAGSQNSGGAYLKPPSGEVPARHDVFLSRIVPLDAEEFLHPIRFLKVDVEGAEPLVFRGAERLLRNDRPLILSEINSPRMEEISGCSARQLIGEFQEIGYECRLLENGRPGRPLRDSPGDKICSVVFRPRDARPG